MKQHKPARVGRPARYGHDTARGVFYQSPQWQQLREVVLRAAKFCCVLCSKMANQVDHIDNDPKNNAMTNLRALCTVCHGRKTRSDVMQLDKIKANYDKTNRI